VKDEDFIGPIFFVIIAGIAIWYFHARSVASHPPVTTVPPATSIPNTQNPVISGIINGVPVVGAILGPLENKVGQAIESLPPPPGIAGSTADVNLSNAGGGTFTLNVWSQQGGWAPWARSVGGGVETAAKAVGSAVKTAVEPWNW
jgi:hypothetical protein